MIYRPTRAEQETTIVFDAERDEATVYTANPSTLRKLDKLSSIYPETYKRIWGDPNGLAARFTCPKRYIRFGKPASESRKAANLRNLSKTAPNGEDKTEA